MDKDLWEMNLKFNFINKIVTFLNFKTVIYITITSAIKFLLIERPRKAKKIDNDIIHLPKYFMYRILFLKVQNNYISSLMFMEW